MTAVAGRWGRDIETGVVAGYPCRLYSRRPRAVFELLVDARRWGDRCFIVQGERRMTVSAHERAVAHAAHYLGERGVAAGTRVMLLGYNRPEWLVAFWAIQCLGRSFHLDLLGKPVPARVWCDSGATYVSM